MILKEDYFGKHINEEFSDDMGFLMDYLKTKEQKDEFIKAYMYILSTGMGDGITESVDNLLTEASKQATTGFDNPLKGIMSFIKGRKFVGTYYKGLIAAADKFINANKKIDKMADSGGENIGKERQTELKQYESQLKKLDAIKKDLDELKKDSFMLAQFEKMAELKYKFKIFRTGKKSQIAAAKLRGYSDQIDDLKKEESRTKQEWDEAQSKAEGQGELAQKFEDDPEMKKFKERSEKIDTKKRRLNLELEGASKEEQAEIKAELKELEKEGEKVDKETNEYIKSQYPDLWKKLGKEEEEAKKNKKVEDEVDDEKLQAAEEEVTKAKTELDTAQGEYDKVKDGEDEEAKKKAEITKLAKDLTYQNALLKVAKIKKEDTSKIEETITNIQNRQKELGEGGEPNDVTLEKAEEVVQESKVKFETAQAEYDKVKDGEDEEAKKKANINKLDAEITYLQAQGEVAKLKGEKEKQQELIKKVGEVTQQLKDLGAKPTDGGEEGGGQEPIDGGEEGEGGNQEPKKDKTPEEKELSQVEDELDDLEDDKDELDAKKQKAQIDADLAQKKKEKEEAEKTKQNEIESLQKKIDNAYSLLDEKEKEKENTEDAEEKANIQTTINSLEQAIQDDEKKLEDLKTQSNESILPISFFYDLILLEKSISSTIDKLNGNA